MNDEAIEQVASAHRPAGVGELRDHAAWHDLTADERDRAYELGRQLRAIEAALDREQLSAAARGARADHERPRTRVAGAMLGSPP